MSLEYFFFPFQVLYSDIKIDLEQLAAFSRDLKKWESLGAGSVGWEVWTSVTWKIVGHRKLYFVKCESNKVHSIPFLEYYCI